MKALSRKIIELRRKKGWNQNTLAKSTGLSHTTILRLERGDDKDPKMTTLVALAKALRVSLDYLTSPRHDQDLQSVIMLRPGQAAKLLGIHVNTVRRWADAGILTSVRLGSRGDRRFGKKDVQKLLTSKISTS